MDIPTDAPDRPGVSVLSCVLLCNSVDCSRPGSSVHGIFQERVLERVAISYSGDLLDPGVKPSSLASPALAEGFLTSVPLGKLNLDLSKPRGN